MQQQEITKSDAPSRPPPLIQPRPLPPHPAYQPMLPNPLQPIPPFQSIDPPPKSKKDRACDLCRRKKTRCDYDQRYPQRSCSSCTSYGETCTFKEAAQKRGPLKTFVEGLEERLQRVEKLLMDVASSGKLPQPALRDLSLSDDTDGDSVKEDDEQQQPSSAPIPTASQQQSSPSIYQNGGKRKHNNDDYDDDDDNNATKRMCGACTSPKRQKTANDGSYSLMGSSSGIYMLGKLFPQHQEKPNAERQAEEGGLVFPKALRGYGDDLMIARPEFTKAGDCSLFSMPVQDDPPAWNLPAKEVVDRLVELYFKRMNVFLPILDQDEFYEGYRKGTDPPSKPLLVAVCRSACRLLDEDDWVVKKYNINRGTLFDQFTSQLTRWYRPDFLMPRLEEVQGLLLSACTANKWTAESVDWLGISIAVKMAQDLGLHRSHACDANLTPKMLETRRRVWWCAYVLDRWVAATLGRPLTISDADCDVEVPPSSDSSSVFLVHFIRISAILGDILRSICSPRARGFCDKRFGINKVCQRLEETLQDWEKSLPEPLRLCEHELKRLESRDISLELELKLNCGAAQLRLAYNSVLLLLKRPFIALGRDNFDMPDACRKSVKEIISIFEAVQLKSLLSFSWSVMSYVLCQSLIITYMNLRNVDPQISDDAVRDMEQIFNQYRRLEAYITEPSALPFMDTLRKILQDDKYNAATSEDVVQHGDVSKTDSETEDSFQQASSTPFMGASSGLDWQDLMSCLTGSQFTSIASSYSKRE